MPATRRPPPPGPAAGGYPPPPGYGNYPPPPTSWSQPGPGTDWAAAPAGYLAGWWYRVGATVIDGLILAVPNFALSYGVGRGGSLLSLIISAGYITLMLGARGQTLGNMAVGTRVVDSRTAGPVTYAKALGRWAAEFLLIILFFLPWVVDILWPLWDRQKQTLHDKMAGTVVLRTS